MPLRLYARYRLSYLTAAPESNKNSGQGGLLGIHSFEHHFSSFISCVSKNLGEQKQKV